MNDSEKMDGLVRVKQFHGIILSFMTYLRQAEQSRVLDQLQSLNPKYEATQVDYYSACSKCTETEVRLEELRALSEEKKQSFEEDFEQILAIDVIRKIRIAGNKLLLYTGVIYQTVEGKDYDIGQYEITVDYENQHPQPRSRIEFRSQPYRGLYYHKWVSVSPSNAVCFGNPENEGGGLNIPIEKCLVDFALVPLAHLIIGFLKHEVTEPGKHSLEVKLGEPDPTGYSSESEKAGAKGNFVKFCTRMSAKLSTQSMENELTELRTKREDLHKKANSLRSKLKSLCLRNEMLRKGDVEKLSENAMKQASLLSNFPQIQKVSTERKTFIIDFQWDGMELTLELEHHNPPRLHGKDEDLKRLSGMLTGKKHLMMDVKVLRVLADAQANHRFHEVFKMTLDFLESRKGQIIGFLKGGHFND